MKRTNEKGFAMVEIAMLVVIIAIFGFVAYSAVQAAQTTNEKTALTAHVSPTPKPTTKSVDESASALANVKAFYKKDLDTAFTSDKSTFSGNVYAVSDWVTDNFVTQAAADQENNQHAVDLATCSQSPLTYDQYTFSTPKLSGITGTMNLTGTYKGISDTDPSDDTTALINLVLIKDGAIWKINKFDCPNLTR